MPRYNIKVAGIPAIADVTYFHHSPPSGRPLALCETPEEAFGETEIEYRLYDRKGYLAEWLERKAEREDLWDSVERQIFEQMESEKYDV